LAGLLRLLQLRERGGTADEIADDVGLGAVEVGAIGAGCEFAVFETLDDAAETIF
jgi:hypothetical protein